MKKYKILVINPGSTSTKIAVFEDNDIILDETIRHSKEDLMQFDSVIDQREYRVLKMREVLTNNNLNVEDMDATAARGGLIKPLESGTYEINEAMVKDLHTEFAAMHASCLAGLIGYDLKIKYNIPAYVVDPVVVDELQDVARLTGLPGQSRVSVFHALNHKAVGRECAEELNKEYEECNFIIAHLGGGITVGAHHKGKAIDVNNGITGEGPLSPERCGALPVMKIAKLAREEDYSYADLEALCTKTGGMSAYLDTNDLRVCEKMIEQGNKQAQLIYDTMAYQIAKEIGSMAAVLSGEVDRIILTGGLAYSNNFTSKISEMVKFIAPLKIYPGEFEVEALASCVRRVLYNQITPKIYK